MQTAIVAVVVLALLAFAGILLGERLGARISPGREITPARRRRSRMLIGLMFIPAGVTAWAIASGRPIVAIAVLVATLVVPDLVVRTVQVRRSRRRTRRG
jgi:hypothetical protein